ATAIGAYILASYQDPSTTLVNQAGVSAAFLFVLAFSVLSVVLGLMLKRHPLKWVPETAAERDARRGKSAMAVPAEHHR
ncbi:MAG: hypothetical protein L0H32_12530, partial [Micrococcaceae bacterium]|nr:hypothetical protein [Micrococcaceae bacterium]